MPRVKKTPEEISAARRRAGLARQHPELRGSSPPPPPPPPAEPGDLPGLCAYDGKVAKPQTYHDAKAREQAIAEELANAKRRDELAVWRGQLFTREQVERRESEHDEALMAALAKLPDIAAATVTEDQRDAIRTAAKGWLAELRKQIAEAVKGGRRA